MSTYPYLKAKVYDCRYEINHLKKIEELAGRCASLGNDDWWAILTDAVHRAESDLVKAERKLLDYVEAEKNEPVAEPGTGART